MGKDSRILHTPEDIRSGAVDKLLAAAYENGLAEGEFLRVRKDGTRFAASVVVTRRNDASGTADWLPADEQRHFGKKAGR